MQTLSEEPCLLRMKIEIGLASDIEEDIFLLMHRIAEADERDAGMIE